MLLVKDEYGETHTFVMVDAHTHINVEGLKGLLPSEFVSRYHKAVRELAVELRDNREKYRYSFPWELDGESPDFYDFCQRDVYGLVHGEDLVGDITKYLGFDFFITFPSDTQDPLPRDYRRINESVRQALTEKSPSRKPHNNLRFFGFGRVDPNHSDALDTVDSGAQMGLKGFKLHPKSESFKINSKNVRNVLKRLAEHDIPAIFHTQDEMGEQLHKAVAKTVEELVQEDKLDLIPRLKVIIGHAPWNGSENPRLFEALSHPNIFGELSTLKPDSYDTFFSNAQSIDYDMMFEAPGLESLSKKEVEEMYFLAFGYSRHNYWSSKIAFGTDNPYPPAHGMKPLMRYLMGWDFPGNHSDLSNIFGITALKLMPHIARPGSEISGKVSSAKQFHEIAMEEMEEKSTRIIGIDLVIESFPVSRVNGMVITYLTNGRRESVFFNSLFNPGEPKNLIRGNMFDFSRNKIYPGGEGIVDEIEKNIS